MFHLLLDLGADASYWKDPGRWRGPTTFSAAARSSLPHLAVQYKQPEMLQHLLDLGFDPKTLPLVHPHIAVTPLMASVVEHARFPQAYDILSRDPRANFDLRTTCANVHTGHFAAAICSVTILEDLVARTSSKLIEPTAVGHTPLHLVYLPSGGVAPLTQAKRDPLRDTRCLSLRDPEESHDASYFAFRQREMIRWLCQRCPEALFTSDVYGNTPLHYHACPSVGLGSLPKVFEGWGEVRELWETGINRFGWTPQDLNVYE